MDMVKETGFSISELEANEELQRLITGNTLKILKNTDDPTKEMSYGMENVIPQPKVEEPVKEVVVEVPAIIEEVVDPEELKRELLADSRQDFLNLVDGEDLINCGREVDDEDLEDEEDDEEEEDEGGVVVEETVKKVSKPGPKKRGPKPKKGKK
jgi:hypothetical protein